MNPTHTIRSAAGWLLAELARTPPPRPRDTWAIHSTGAGMRLTAGSVSLGRIVAVPFGA